MRVRAGHSRSWKWRMPPPALATASGWLLAQLRLGIHDPRFLR